MPVPSDSLRNQMVSAPGLQFRSRGTRRHRRRRMSRRPTCCSTACLANTQSRRALALSRSFLPRADDRVNGGLSRKFVKQSGQLRHADRAAQQALEAGGARRLRKEALRVDQERLLKRVWLVNGLLLAVLFVALAIWLAVELSSSWFHRHPAVIPATDGAPAERAAREIGRASCRERV